MTARRFAQVDVFTARPLAGNPLAVVVDGEGLGEERMQALARWTNLSETVFVLPSVTADYRVRIFTPGSELAFAGHPTIGTAHALRELGLVDPSRSSFTQECAAGTIPLRVDRDGLIHARVPTPRRVEATLAADELRAVLGGVDLVAPLAIDVGVVWIVARVDGETLASLRPELARMAAYTSAFPATGVTVYAVRGDGATQGSASNAAIEVRSFAPADGIAEDPVCGSGNAAVAAHARLTGALARIGPSYVASQGRFVGRDGRVTVSAEGEQVWIGGHAVTVVRGSIDAG